MEFLFSAILLGLVEGITEFLPVSSTGHLILLDSFLPKNMPGNDVFIVSIQAGAVCAVMSAYASRIKNLFAFGRGYFTRNRWAMLCAVAFVPSVIVGLTAYDFIKTVLFSPYVVCAALFVGGVAMIAIEKYVKKERDVTSVDELSLKTALLIGCCQAIAVIPGSSRSACTILGGLAFGLNRKTAAEFSFLLALPTLFAATALDLYERRDALAPDALALIAIGFLTAFVSAFFSVKALLRYVSRHNFIPFGVYRIILAMACFIFLTMKSA
ncbi:MAG: undecaprenyl-diphosphate phosphatase [Rickettsiales bacterium]